MRLSSDEVKKVAKLANLPLTEKQESLYAEQLSKILEYIDLLNTVNTDGIEPIYNVSENIDVRQEDILSTSITQEEALQNGSQVKEGFFATKGVFNDE